MLDRLAPVMGSEPPYFTTTRPKSLLASPSVTVCGFVREFQLQRAGEDDGSEAGAKADRHSIVDPENWTTD